MNSPRVCIAHCARKNRWTGVGKWIDSVQNALARRGFRVTAWWQEDFPAMATQTRFLVLLYPVFLAFRLVRFRRQFDIVIVHEPSGLWYALLRKIWVSLPPMIAICHNVESKVFGEMLEFEKSGLAVVPPFSRIKAPLFRFWQSNGTIRLADHVVCISSVDREYIVSRLSRDPVTVTFMRNGVLPSRETRPRFASTPKKVLFIGGWIDVKGRRLLPRVWAKVMETRPDAQLTLIGTGSMPEVVGKDFPESCRASLTVFPRVENEGGLMAQIATHDVFLMTSLTEATPLSLLEAMSVGLPSVATRVGGISDVISSGVEGWLFDPRESEKGAELVLRLLSNPVECHQMGAAALRRASALSWDASAETIASAIEKVLSGGVVECKRNSA